MCDKLYSQFLASPSIKVYPQLLLNSNLHPQCSFYCLFSLANGLSHHTWCVILLNDIIDLIYQTFVPLYQKDCCVFYATRCQVRRVLTHNMFFWYYLDLISDTRHKQSHTAHSGAVRPTYPYNRLLYAHSSYLYCIEWVICWYQKFTFHNVFAFQKSFFCRNHNICWLDSVRLSFSRKTQKEY